MRIGVAQWVDGSPARGLEFVQELAVALEDLGYASYWAADHVVLMDHFTSRYPYAHDGAFPFQPDQAFLEPLHVMGAAAAATTRLRVGTGVDILPLRNPVVRAKDIATLDVLSHGRVDYGIGIGWLREEFEALGMPFERRGPRCDEMLAVMKALWTMDRPAFSGEFYRFPEVTFWPKPSQEPHPPILVGGNSRAAMRRAARLGDGWYALGLDGDQLAEHLVALDAELAAVGRGRDEGFAVHVASGGLSDPQAIVEYVRDIAPHGPDEVIIGPPLSRRRFREQLEALAGPLGL